MKKALQGFWRGGVLGGWLGLLGGWVFWIVLMAFLFLVDDAGGGFSEFLSIICSGFQIMQAFSAIPGFIFGFAIGGILGVPSIFFFDMLKPWQKIVFSVVCSALLHLITVRLVIWIDRMEILVMPYREYKLIVWPIYLGAAIIFGYKFNTKNLQPEES